MAVRPIPQIGDPVLRVPTTEVTDFDAPEFQALVNDMIDTMADAQGAGIAANQVGVSMNVCVIGVEHNERYPYKPPIPLTVLVNPVITVLDDERWLNNEGCLSVPIRGDLHRWMNISVVAQTRNGEPFEQIYRGLSAGTVQHEVDHLAGHLIVDRMTDPTSMTTWDNFQKHGLSDYLNRIAPIIPRTRPVPPPGGQASETSQGGV
ncbi:MAG: peptide deformylase [Acidimicrobiia bacterium]|nr:peptide deformylase [Acidimicrobiia bacterium]